MILSANGGRTDASTTSGYPSKDEVQEYQDPGRQRGSRHILWGGNNDHVRRSDPSVACLAPTSPGGVGYGHVVEPWLRRRETASAPVFGAAGQGGRGLGDFQRAGDRAGRL